MFRAFVLAAAAAGLSVAGFSQTLPLGITMKGVHTDELAPIGSGMKDTIRRNVTGNQTGWVAVPFDWPDLVGDDAGHADRVTAAQCPAPYSFGYTDASGMDHDCYHPQHVADLDEMTDYYEDLGVRMVGIITRVPNFARIPNCGADGITDPGALANCAVAATSIDGLRKGTDWLRVLSRFLAERYGQKVHVWVVLNEVNTAGYFRTGCRDCSGNTGAWINLYAQAYAAAYDGIQQGFATSVPLAGRPVSPAPRVLVSMGGLFDAPWDVAMIDPANGMPSATGVVRFISERTFLSGFDAALATIPNGPRHWDLAQHAYPRIISSPSFNANDLTDGSRGAGDLYASYLTQPRDGLRGVISPGTIGAVVAYMQGAFPGKKIYMTEGGINTSPQDMLCDAFQDYTGTPGVEMFLLQRMIDDPAEESGLVLGLADGSGQFKPGWTTFALSNRYQPDATPQCGFQNLPYTALQRAYGEGRHRVTSRKVIAAAYSTELTWYLFRDPRPDTQALYECWLPVSGTSGRTFASSHIDCDIATRPGAVNLGPMGYAYAVQPVDDAAHNWRLLYGCKVNGTFDDIVTEDRNCENWGSAAGVTLGWARTSPSNADNSKTTLLRRSHDGVRNLHWATSVLPPASFTQEVAWKILREPQEGTRLLYECQYADTGTSFPSDREDCENAPGTGTSVNLGPLGYLYKEPVASVTGAQLFRCRRAGDPPAGPDHMVSDRADCEDPVNWVSEGSIGYALPDP
jgi:hypothetical protein